MNDQALWQQLKDGKKEALEKIYRQEVKALLLYGKKFSNDEQLIEDSIQDLFIELWNNRATLGATNAIRPYLLISLRRKIIRNISQTKKRFSENEPEEYQFKMEFAIEDLIIQKELSSEQSTKLKASITTLSKRQQEALYLKYYSEMDYKDIAEIMDINYQSVRNLIFNALKLLKDQMLFWLLVLQIYLQVSS